MLEIFVGVVLVGSAAVVARFAGEGRGSNVLAVCASLIACASVWTLQRYDFVRFLMALLSAVLFARCIGFMLEGASLSCRQRALTLLVIFDVRRVERTEPKVAPGKMLHTLAHGTLCALAVLTLVASPFRGPDLEHWIARWGLGALAVYAFVPALVGTIESLTLATGWQIPPSHCDPILSRSVAEFWNRRWNLIVHRYLRRYAFVPVLRARGAAAAVVWVFFLSALLHCWYVAVVFRGPWLLATFVFFNVQSLYILAEQALGQGRWPRAAQRVWTAACLLLPSPAFVEPMLRIFGL